MAVFALFLFLFPHFPLTQFSSEPCYVFTTPPSASPDVYNSQFPGPEATGTPVGAPTQALRGLAQSPPETTTGCPRLPSLTDVRHELSLSCN